MKPPIKFPEKDHYPKDKSYKGKEIFGVATGFKFRGKEHIKWFDTEKKQLQNYNDQIKKLDSYINSCRWDDLKAHARSRKNQIKLVYR